MTPGRRQDRFDPYAILGALQAARVDYVLIGGLARVIQGSDEITRGVDLVPSRRPPNIERLDGALTSLGALAEDASVAGALSCQPTKPLTLETGSGQIIVVLEPAGTRGYEDLRRKATRAALGNGLRPQVAAPGDLVRMLESLDRSKDRRIVESMRRVVELDRGLGLEGSG